ncbi:hypothetical protein BMF31_13930, partial [Staphylococcus aureus]
MDGLLTKFIKYKKRRALNHNACHLSLNAMSYHSNSSYQP